ncbi:MAG: hypothetical protein R3B60_05185 [Candidatus Paceibacterota bacterium]
MKINAFTIIVLLLLLVPQTSKADSTVIYNSVSVSANSGDSRDGGESSISVKTIHNGETVEDIYISTTTNLTYQNEYVNNNKEDTKSKIQVNASAHTDNKNQTQQLTLLLNNLLILLDYYEKLLDKQQ